MPWLCLVSIVPACETAVQHRHWSTLSALQFDCMSCHSSSLPQVALLPMLSLPVGLPFALSFQVAAAPPPLSLELLESLASVLFLPAQSKQTNPTQKEEVEEFPVSMTWDVH